MERSAAGEAYGRIRRRLLALRNRIARNETAIFACRAAGLFAGFFVAALLADLSPLPAALFRIVLYVFLVLFLFLVVRAAVVLARRWPRLEWIAAEAERATPEMEGDLLRGALDLGGRRDHEKYGYSPALIEALVARALEKSAAIRERVVVDRSRLRRALPLLPASLLALSALFLLVPERAARVAAAFGPHEEGRLLDAVGLRVSPGDCTVEAGEKLAVEARFGAFPGGAVDLLLRTEKDEWRTFPMAETRGGQERLFEAATPPLGEDAEYAVRFDGGESPRFHVAVHHAPVLTGMEYTLRFPSYTGLDDRLVRENHGNVTALFGTEVLLSATASADVAEARLERNGLEPIPMHVNRNEISGSFRVGERFSYVVDLVDGDGGRNVDPVRYEVVPVEDERPFVRILQPGENVDLDREMKIDLRFSALDDFGITAVNLIYRKGEGEEKKVPLFSTEHRQAEIDRLREWDLSDERILPQDVVTYYLEAWDNDSIGGPKRGVSRTFQVRMPSLAEIFAEVTGDQETKIADLEDLYDEGRDLEEKLQDLSREIEKNEDLSWDEKKKIEGILEKQKQIEESLREVSKEVEKSSDRLEENRLVTPETIERMAELTRLMNEVATEEMRQAMRDLQAAMRDLDREEIRKASENLDLTQKDFLERLDRAIDMLKRLRDLQEMDALAEGLRRLAEQQRDLRERTESAGDDQTKDLAAEEEALRKELDEWEKRMNELAERSEENSPDLSEALEQSLSDMQEKKPGSKMSQSADMLRKGQKKEASESQQEAENDLFDISFRLSRAFQTACSAAQTKATAAFGESIQDLLHLSESQEGLLDRASGVRRGAPIGSRRSLAERQQEISIGVGRVMEKVREVGREVPDLSFYVLDLLRRGRMKADRAAERFESGEIDLGRTRAGEAMQHMNRSVIELLRSQENHSSSCSNPNGQSQGLQQMQQMTEQQRSLNDKASHIPTPSSNPSTIPMETRAQMARLAAEQNQIRKGMEELQREVEEGDGETPGKLDGIMEEMRQVERDLENASLSPETRERQERILSRMLDAERSLRERGYRRQRRSRTGGAVEAGAPGAIPRALEEGRETMRDDPLRTPGFVYPPEYEELIHSYFRKLEEEE